jgi:hypothetical protein
MECPALCTGNNRFSSDYKSGLDIRRQFAAIGSKLCHDLLVQPNIHGR